MTLKFLAEDVQVLGGLGVPGEVRIHREGSRPNNVHESLHYLPLTFPTGHINHNRTL